MCVYSDVVQVLETVANVVNSVIQVQEIRADRAESEYNIELYKAQAKKAEDNAIYERQEGIEEARKQRLNAILSIADEKSAIASSNLSLTGQTSLNLADDQKLNGELNALTTLKNSEKRANAYIDAANNYYMKAALSDRKANDNFKKNIISLTRGK